jgi:hypothetical protein
MNLALRVSWCLHLDELEQEEADISTGYADCCSEQ